MEHHAGLFKIAKFFDMLKSMANKGLIEKSKKRLLAEKQHLEQLLSRVAKKDEKAGDFHARYPEFGSTEDDNAAEVAAYETNLAEEYDLEQRLRRVEVALGRIAAGTYGVCQAGGEMMPVARLEAVPEAENCVEHEK